jgi:glutamate carboxypeptidase
MGDGEAALVGGGSDANTLAAIGVPAIDGLGPRGRGFHTHDEYIEPATLVPRAQALTATLLALRTDVLPT